MDITTMSHDDLLKLVPQLLAKLEAAQKPKALHFKVSEKGALSIYGMGKFPITLYISQWERIFAQRQAIVDFAKANHALLTRKDD